MASRIVSCSCSRCVHLDVFLHPVCELRVAVVELAPWLTPPSLPPNRSSSPPAPFLPPRSLSPPHHQVAPTADYHAFDTARAVAEAKEGAPRYAVVPSTAPMFFPGFGASIELSFPDGSKETVGHFGILHPEVLQNFSISMPVTVLEMGLGECQFVVCFVSSFL